MDLSKLTAAVVAAARRHRNAVRDWQAADDHLDSLRGPKTPAEKRAWAAANRAERRADDAMWAAERALFRAVDRLDKAQGLA